MPLHSVLGYIAVVLAVLGFAAAVAAHLGRTAGLSRLMMVCFLLCVVVQVPTLVTGVIDNAALKSAAVVAPYNVFIGASFFTLSAILTAWRGFNPQVAWDDRYWLSYLTGALGNVLLSGALIWLGILAVGTA